MRHQCYPTTTRCVTEPPPIVAYEHHPNLMDLLVRAAYGQTKETYSGNSQWQQPSYKTRHHIKTGTSFCSRTTGELFRVKATADCRTRNVVHLIKYKKYTIQYIGETENALCGRLTGHRSGIKQCRTVRSVAEHLSLPDYSMEDLSIMVTDKIYGEHTDYWRRKESHWIEIIRSLTPDGLNLIL